MDPPYVVGRVPWSLNSRESEFEGPLRDNDSSAKVISLTRDGPVKQDIRHVWTHPFAGRRCRVLSGAITA